MQFVRTELGADPIIVESYFGASPAKVFQAWTDPLIVVKWFGHTPNSLHSAKIDLRPGGRWQFLRYQNDEETGGFEGEYLEVLPGKLLVFSWAHVVQFADGRREETPYSRVEVEFSAKGAGTFVRLTHIAISNEQSRLGIGGGWEAAFGFMADIFNETETGRVTNGKS